VREHEGHRSSERDLRHLGVAYKCCRDAVVGWMNQRTSTARNMLEAIVEGDQEPDNRVE
jgi:hypothetical protein